VCGRSAQATSRKSCTADRKAAAEPGLISAGFAPAAGLRRVCGWSAQATARKSCTADRKAAAEPGTHISRLRASRRFAASVRPVRASDVA
jgi:hypothetical protein